MKENPEQHEYTTDEIDSHYSSSVVELVSPLQRIMQPSPDQYLPGIGEEIELFSERRDSCDT